MPSEPVRETLRIDEGPQPVCEDEIEVGVRVAGERPLDELRGVIVAQHIDRDVIQQSSVTSDWTSVARTCSRRESARAAARPTAGRHRGRAHARSILRAHRDACPVVAASRQIANQWSSATCSRNRRSSPAVHACAPLVPRAGGSAMPEELRVWRPHRTQRHAARDAAPRASACASARSQRENRPQPSHPATGIEPAVLSRAVGPGFVRGGRARVR